MGSEGGGVRGGGRVLLARPLDVGAVHSPVPSGRQVRPDLLEAEAPSGVARLAQAPGHKPPPVAATSASTAPPRDAGIAAWAPGRQSPPVAATSARAEASPREARVAQAPGGQPVATSVRAEFSPWENRFTPASGKSTAAVRRDTVVHDKLGGAFPAICHRDTSLSPNCGAPSGYPRAATVGGPGRGEGFAGTAAKCKNSQLADSVGTPSEHGLSALGTPQSVRSPLEAKPPGQVAEATSSTVGPPGDWGRGLKRPAPQVPLVVEVFNKSLA